MKKTICVVASLGIISGGTAWASGYRIPEQSVDATAKASANIASASRADTAYYNPAKMTWMEDTWHIQGNLTYLYLSSVEYEDDRTPAFDSDSEKEHCLLPTGFIVSPSYGGARFGLSITEPFGLKKRWQEGYAKAFAEEFSLVVFDINPTVSYGIGDMFSVAAGLRMIYSEAKVKSTGLYVPEREDDEVVELVGPFSRSMEDGTIEWGWNVALAAKPNERLDLAVTYRSNVDLEFEDNSYLNIMGNPFTVYGEVEVPAPAVLAVAVAYDVTDKLNIELVWDRTFWSEYDALEFNYAPPFNDPESNPFALPAARDWDDADTFRIGITYKLNEKYTLMAGFAYDDDPIPTENLEFSTPDSTGYIYTIGMQYAVNGKMDIGIAALYDHKETRSNTVDPEGIVFGEFSNACAVLVTAGLNYRF